MKKISFITACAAGLGILFSCTNEKFETTGNMGLATVTVTASIGSAAPAVKSLPAAPAGHQLRCIMVVDYPTAADSRYETVANGTGNFTFSFTPQENGYTCLLWADYVATGEAADGKYADKYYDTGDLKAIGYVEAALTDGSLFNNDACDAFYGTLEQGKTSVTLYRPFTKLTFKNTGDDAIGGIEKLAVSYEVYSSFNVANGTASATATIAMTDGTAADAGKGIWFYNYVFAPKDQNRLPGNEITFQKNSDSPRKISTENMPIDANADQGFSFTYGEQIDITVDIEDNFGEKPKPEVHVGDYYYSDGTWGTEYGNLDGKTVIGVVFATAEGAAKGDVPANYEGSALASAKEITGWVVSAYDCWNGSNYSPRYYGTENIVPEESVMPSGLGTDKTTSDGYRNTRLMLSDSAFQAALAATNNEYNTKDGNVKISAPENTSGWYLPSAGQMTELFKVYAATNADGTMGEALAVQKALSVLPDVGEGGKEKLAAIMAANYYWTSTGAVKDNKFSLCRGSFNYNNNKNDYSKIGSGSNSGSRIRAILTF